MRTQRGFTLLEVMVVVVIIGILAALVVWQGRSARQAAGLSGGAYEIALKVPGIRARAMSEGRTYLMIVADPANAAECVQLETRCGRVLVMRDPVGFAIDGFDPDPPYAGADFVDDLSGFLPRNSRLDLASTWRPPPPFAAVAPFDPSVVAGCAGGRTCFALQFRPDGEIWPLYPGARPAPEPTGFSFVLRPVEAPSAAAERRAVFVSFPGGIVKTAAF